MEKFKKQLIANKQIIVIATFVCLISGLLGFYGGRYYERNIFRQSFASRRGTMMQNRNNTNGDFNRGGMMDNQNFQRPENR